MAQGVPSPFAPQFLHEGAISEALVYTDKMERRGRRAISKNGLHVLANLRFEFDHFLSDVRHVVDVARIRRKLLLISKRCSALEFMRWMAIRFQRVEKVLRLRRLEVMCQPMPGVLKPAKHTSTELPIAA